MENNKHTHFIAFNTPLGITIYGFSRKPPFHDHKTPEKAIDHLLGKMLMKVAHLRSEAQLLSMAMIDFQELERTQLENIYETDDIFEAVYELLPCNVCPINPGNGKCNCLESMDGAYK